MNDMDHPGQPQVPPPPSAGGQHVPAGGQEVYSTSWGSPQSGYTVTGEPHAAPGAQPPSAPIPEEAPARRQPPRLLTVAAVAALVGSLVGAGVATRFATLDSDPAAPTATISDRETAAPLDPVEGDTDRVAAVAQRVLPSVVQINVGGGGLLGQPSGNGSGVIYRADGYIVTNNHVVASGGTIDVVLPDGTRLPATVVGTDPDNDLAVVKVDRDDLPAIAIGDSAALRVGELAVAVGSPFGLESTVTAGVISALNRPIQVGGPNGQPIVLPNVIQTDAAINPGNSGGALVNGRAQLVGLNSAILTAGTAANAGVGFAIPVNTVVDIADELIAQGFVQHAFLGVSGLNVTAEVAERLGIDSGAFIQMVQPETPAAEAGLRPGDVIVRFGDVAVESMDGLVIAVRNADVGQNVEVTYIRDGEQQVVTVTLTEKPR